MAQNIEELIIENVVTTLQGVTTGNGYNCTLTVTREKQEGNSPQDQLAVVDPKEVRPAPESAQMFQYYVLPVEITVFAIEPDGSDTPITQRLVTIAADIRKGLLIDTHRGTNPDTNQGLAMYTAFPDRDEYSLQAPACVLVRPHILYRTRYGNPYLQA